MLSALARAFLLSGTLPNLMFIVATNNRESRPVDTRFFVAILNNMRADKAQRGRPPKEPAERRSDELRIRLTSDERAALDEWAHAQGQETSTLARTILLQLVNRKNRSNPG